MKKMALLLAALLLLGSLAGCGKSSKGEASVESVSMICGLSGVGQVDRFAGVVSAQGETKIAKDENRQVASVAVKAGDEVKKGQTLFTYDQTQAQLDLEKAQLELDQMKSTLSAKQEEKARLERDKSNVSSDQQLQYDLEIREATAAILEQQYNISLKEKEVQRLTASVGNAEITSPVDGRVQTVNENGGTDSNGNQLPFMTIVETAGFRVKGYVNESNAAVLSEGTQVLIRSRVGSDVWKQRHLHRLEKPCLRRQSEHHGRRQRRVHRQQVPLLCDAGQQRRPADGSARLYRAGSRSGSEAGGHPSARLLHQ